MNKLNVEKKVAAVGMLCEGTSIRAVERITGVHRDTIMRLGVRMGEGCQRIMDEKMQNLPCRLIQVDEIWGFVGMKQKTALRQHRGREVGDVWTWVALDSETKLVPTFAVGDRSGYMADCFIEDLASRLSSRVQLSSDALRAYADAVERAFGAEVDYGSVVKTFGQADVQEQRRYSPPKITGVRRMPVQDFKLGHYLILAGVCLALLGSVALSAPVASAKGQLKYNPAGRFIDLSVLPPGFDCSQIYEKGIDRQENFRAGQIMIACGLAEGGSASRGSGFFGNGLSQWVSNLLPAPLFIGGTDS